MLLFVFCLRRLVKTCPGFVSSITAFKGYGGWYIENSLTTFGEKDPVSEYNSMLWNNGTEAGKDRT